MTLLSLADRKNAVSEPTNHGEVTSYTTAEYFPKEGWGAVQQERIKLAD